jgi:hypothetical protein
MPPYPPPPPPRPPPPPPRRPTRLAADALGGGLLKTSTRPTLNRRTESVRLCGHSP